MPNKKITEILLQYANKRLYDPVKSKYVTLDQLAEMIRKGNRVEVFKAKTEEDVTAFILTQIVMEKAKNRNALLPVPLLHLIAFLKLCPFGASIKAKPFGPGFFTSQM